MLKAGSIYRFLSNLPDIQFNYKLDGELFPNDTTHIEMINYYENVLPGSKEIIIEYLTNKANNKRVLKNRNWFSQLSLQLITSNIQLSNKNKVKL